MMQWMIGDGSREEDPKSWFLVFKGMDGDLLWIEYDSEIPNCEMPSLCSIQYIIHV